MQRHFGVLQRFKFCARMSEKIGFAFNRGFKSDKLAAGKYITRHVVIVHQLIHRCRGLCFLPKGNTALHTAVTRHMSSRRCAAAARCHPPFAAFRPCSPPAYGSHVTRHTSHVTRHMQCAAHLAQRLRKRDADAVILPKLVNVFGRHAAALDYRKLVHRPATAFTSPAFRREFGCCLWPRT